MTRLLLTFSLLLLTACLAPDGSTITVATVDEENRVQVQHIEVSSEEEFYRGVWTMCVFASAAQNDGYGDVTGCTELTATAYAHDTHLDAGMLEHWRYDLVQIGD